MCTSFGQLGAARGRGPLVLAEGTACTMSDSIPSSTDGRYVVPRTSRTDRPGTRTALARAHPPADAQRMQGVVQRSRPAEGVHGMRLTTVWMVAAVAVPTALVLATPLSSVDLAYQLRAGAMMLDSGHVLRTDPFTVAALGHPWLNQQWAASVLFAALFRAGGWLSLAGLRAVCAALAMASVYASCRNAGASRRWSTGLTLAGGVLATGGFLVRAQLLGMVCFAATQWLLSRRDRHPLGVLWILPITIVWANTHGSFFLAPILCAIALADPARRGRRAAWHLSAITAASLAMTLLNPFGARVWGYVVTIAGDTRIRNVATEWQAPTLETWAGALFLVSVVAAALFVGAHWSRTSWPMLAGLGLFLVLGLVSIRGTLWWALAAPYLLAWVRPGGDEAERRDPRGSVNVAIAAVFCLVAVAPLLRWVPYTTASTPPALVTAAPAGIT